MEKIFILAMSLLILACGGGSDSNDGSLTFVNEPVENKPNTNARVLKLVEKELNLCSSSSSTDGNSPILDGEIKNGLLTVSIPVPATLTSPTYITPLSLPEGFMAKRYIGMKVTTPDEYLTQFKVGSEECQLWYVNMDAVLNGMCNGQDYQNIELKKGWNYITALNGGSPYKPLPVGTVVHIFGFEP